MTTWRRDIHMHPELAFEEKRTSTMVADKLESFGIEVHRGLARTGVVGTLRAGSSARAIGLRADMDALPIQEDPGREYRSVHDGVMHACGHDGHTAMLLGAAKHLAESRGFDGTVQFIFQPAEECEGGGRVMVEEGLFDRFPVDAVYGMHNMPGLAVGRFAMRVGPMMAAYDTFEIQLDGVGGHAAMPHTTVDPVVVGAEVVAALQSITSRTVNPLDSAVVSVTMFHAGDAKNVIPASAHLAGCTRSLTPEVRAHIETSLRRVVEGICAAHGASATIDYRRGYPPTINTEVEVGAAADAARAVAGSKRVYIDVPPTMASEDFAFMLQERPGAYIFVGNGGGPGTCMVHNPGYDFNDDVLVHGARYWVELVERQLPSS